LVFADGPRADVATDATLCAETRALIERVDWPCEIETNFSDVNLGQRKRMESGLDWVFETVEEAIILEDDCLPDPSFFGYCEELLGRFRDDDRVFSISGDDFCFRPEAARTSYTFARYSLIWGWATWRRAWRHFDASLSDWPSVRTGGWLEGILGDQVASGYWAHEFDRAHAGTGSWDFAWVFACWRQGALSALPTTNLVSNIGFRDDATHTLPRGEYASQFAGVPTAPIGAPLVHPERVEPDGETEEFLEDVMFSGNLHRVFARLRAGLGARDGLSA
jgi:hypothetical protein